MAGLSSPADNAKRKPIGGGKSGKLTGRLAAANPFKKSTAVGGKGDSKAPALRSAESVGSAPEEGRFREGSGK